MLPSCPQWPRLRSGGSLEQGCQRASLSGWRAPGHLSHAHCRPASASVESCPRAESAGEPLLMGGVTPSPAPYPQAGWTGQHRLLTDISAFLTSLSSVLHLHPWAPVISCGKQSPFLRSTLPFTSQARRKRKIQANTKAEACEGIGLITQQYELTKSPAQLTVDRNVEVTLWSPWIRFQPGPPVRLSLAVFQSL